jgi:hypothetical protein
MTLTVFATVTWQVKAGVVGIPWDSKPRITVLARASSNLAGRQAGKPVIRESVGGRSRRLAGSPELHC